MDAIIAKHEALFGSCEFNVRLSAIEMLEKGKQNKELFLDRWTSKTVGELSIKPD